MTSSIEGKIPLPRFAAMLCLYKNNVASEVQEALSSAFEEQVLPPDQLIAVFDGPIPQDVQRVIEEFSKMHDVRMVVHSECRGHGPARSAAIAACQYQWIAIIDADDVSLPNRFSDLVEVIAAHPESAVVGGGLVEFEMKDGEKVLGHTVLYPETPKDVGDYIKARSPIAQPTSMLRIDAINAVGGYQDWFNNEDYHLWIRLVSAGYELRNVPRPLLQFRVDADLFRRRGGIRYWWNEVKLQLFSLDRGTTSVGRVFAGALVRFLVQVILPPKGRDIFYNKVLRRI